jgi:hypothetical protein
MRCPFFFSLFFFFFSFLSFLFCVFFFLGGGGGGKGCTMVLEGLHRRGKAMCLATVMTQCSDDTHIPRSEDASCALWTLSTHRI